MTGMSASTEITDGFSIALVGCGKMGESILKGWIASDVAPADALSPSSFCVVEPSDQHRERIRAQHGIDVFGNVSELSGRGSFDMVVLAVKPQVMTQVLEEVQQSGIVGPQTIVATIAAGIPTHAYERSLSEGTRVVRVMPNMPLQVGMGASVVCGGANALPEDVALVNSLFAALGTSSIVPEDQVDAVCAISGGGPAYVAYMVEALRDAGVALGLSADVAEQLATQTLGGTYRAMVEGETSPEDMRISVCSPGGTTLAALASMDDDGFKPMFERAMQAAVDRAEELRS